MSHTNGKRRGDTSLAWLALTYLVLLVVTVLAAGALGASLGGHQ
ncbi:hypothetical protein QTQ03_28055 [Micromonospora sp. WMMA1363]|nr:hypothetical protein [Micromonospora sp. WMMA1363]MDM4721175.1 hypothetical protein [Micromonospora sp. WMMA1363]MDM4722733.1 hypothetical protein [Micromonospora sp. WMMA1363]MDM4723263.1 hypothetical protein [Micromonospora sp. WMMA1363]